VKFYLEHHKKRKCWVIYDIQQPEKFEPVAMMTIGDELMDRYLTALLISNGAIEFNPHPSKLNGKE
jgi:hypothetical protein